MKGLKIVGTGRSLPGKHVSNVELCKRVDSDDEWIFSRTGIRGRYYCEEETTASMALEAAKKAIEASGIEKEEIGILLVATSTPEYAFPSTACLVQQALELSEDMMSFDISAACAGFLYGLGIVRGMLLAAKKKYALVIGSEHLSKILNYEDRGSCILFGDGAGAAVVCLDERPFFHTGWTRGNHDYLYCHGLGSKKMDGFLHMDGNQVFRFAVTAIEQGVEEVLKEMKLSMEDIDWVICHQANGRIIDFVEKKYRKYDTKFYRNIETYGNTSAASVAICLDEMKEKGLLTEGMKVIMVGFGAGFTWSSTLITI